MNKRGIDCSGCLCRQAFRAIGLDLVASDCVPRPRTQSWLRVDVTKGAQLRAAGRMFCSIYPSITSAGTPPSIVLGGDHVEV